MKKQPVEGLAASESLSNVDSVESDLKIATSLRNFNLFGHPSIIFNASRLIKDKVISALRIYKLWPTLLSHGVVGAPEHLLSEII